MGRKRKGRLVPGANACNVSELCKLYADTAVDYCKEIDESGEDAEIPTLFDFEFKDKVND